MKSIKILGSGTFVPELIVTNEDFAKVVETSDEWITSRTGMKERHIATDQPSWYLGARAAENAIKDSGLSPTDIDMVIVSTVTPDFHTPSTACIIQNHLGIPEAIALDINVACTAFSFGLDMARRYLATGDVTNILLVAAESLSQMTNYEDRSTCVLFGDGGSAMVITGANGIYGSYQSSDASGVGLIHAHVPRKTHVFSPSPDTSKYDPFTIEGEDYFYMNGNEVYKFATKAMPTAIEKACQRAGISLDDLDVIIPHQANLRIILTAIRNLKLDKDKFFINIEKYGNTSSASASIALHEAVEQGLVKRGSKICVVGFGAGLTYGATVFEY